MPNGSTEAGFPGELRPNDAAHLLDALVGNWTIEIVHPLAHGGTIRGKANFEWLGNRSFLIHRWEVEHPDFPDGLAVIGRGDSGREWAMHLFDSRGVHRVYATTFRDGQWAIWRDWPGFSQRFAGVLSEGGQLISGRWEKSEGGATWEHDFDMSYRRAR